MTVRPICFVDVESTALGAKAVAWEVAIVRREVDGTVHQGVLQQAFTLWTLPEGTEPQALDVGGWLRRGQDNSSYLADLPESVRILRTESEETFARQVHGWLHDEPLLVGVGVAFDAAVLSSMFLRHDLPEQPWHYGIVDLKAATWGNLLGQDTVNGLGGVPVPEDLALPMHSERLAAALGVEPCAPEERHTALGDARWAARWYDALTGGQR